MSLQHRRRKATAEELAQGQKEMKEAQRRLEREIMTSGELPLEDGLVGEEIEVVEKGERGKRKARPRMNVERPLPPRRPSSRRQAEALG